AALQGGFDAWAGDGRVRLHGEVKGGHLPASAYCAPLSVQAVEQVVITPRSQAMQTATHCFLSLGLYALYSLRAQLSTEPVTSLLLSGVHAASAAADRKMAMMTRMLVAPTRSPRSKAAATARALAENHPSGSRD